MLTQQISRLRFLLAVDSDQHVCAGNFITPGGLNMKDRTLQYALKNSTLAACRVLPHWQAIQVWSVQ